MTSSLSIAIIGAGPAGLTLARLLQAANTTCHVFDLDITPDSRDQGGSIDLHERGGQLALKEAGLLDEFLKRARPEGECMRVLKFDGTVLADENVDGNRRPSDLEGRPEIDRVELRKILLRSLKPGTVSWGKKLISVEEINTNEGRFRLLFECGHHQTFDIVVGAEGAWSRVRSLLTDTKPFYSGITAVELLANNVSTTNHQLSSFVGAGSMFMFDEGRAIISQRNGDDSIRTYAAVRQPEDWSLACGIDWTSPDARNELVKKYFDNCGAELQRAVLESNDALRVRQLYMLPVGIRWESKPGVTVIGDAAHLMTPFAGVGVNVAMVDALELSKAIVQAQGDGERLRKLMEGFETSMFERAEIFARKTEKNLRHGHFSATGAEARARMIQS